MPSKKRKSTEVSSASPAAPARPTQRVKPSIEVVEVSSDNDDEEIYKAGLQRGLSRVNRLDESSQQSIEQIDDEDAVKKTRHMTRGSRHGRADNGICYNMKCTQAPLVGEMAFGTDKYQDHPMDEVTRPGRAAQVFSKSTAGFGADDGETSDASLPSSAKGSDEESSEDEDEVEEVPERAPHPLATRRSARKPTKDINYSRKHHPQDHALPGYQHKARLADKARKKTKRPNKRATREVQESDQEDGADDGVQASEREEEQLPQQQEEEEAEEDEMEADEPIRPHKKLRMLPDDRSSSPYKSARKRSSAKSSKHKVADQESDSVQATDVEDEAGMNVDGNLFSGADQQASSSDNTEAALNLTGVVAGAEVSSSSRTATRQCGIGHDMFAGEDDEDAASVDDESKEARHNPAEESGPTSSSEDEEVDDEDDENDDDGPSDQPDAKRDDFRQEEDDGFLMNDNDPETPFQPVDSLQDIGEEPPTVASSKCSSQTAPDSDMSNSAEEDMRPEERDVTTQGPATKSLDLALASAIPSGVKTAMNSTEATMHAFISTAAYTASTKPEQEQVFAGAVNVQKSAPPTASSSSTLKADTRKASSSSTLKTSTLKEYSSAVAETRDRQDGQEKPTSLLSDLGEHLTANVRSTEDDAATDPDDASEEDSDRGSDQQQLQGTQDDPEDDLPQSNKISDCGQDQSSCEGAKAVSADEFDESLRPTQPRKATTQRPPAQCVSPAESFLSGKALNSTTPDLAAQRHDQRHEISVGLDDTIKKMHPSQPPPTRPRTHPQSPQHTPRPRLPNPTAPSQRTKGDLLFESDPDSAPTKEDSDPPPSSARASSPSQFLDEVFA